MVSTGNAGRKSAVDFRWAGTAILALLAVFIWTHFHTGPAANQVVGSPTRDQVTGLWGGDYGSNLVLRPDGTFTSSGLPPRVGTAGHVGGPFWPARGMWAIGPGDPGGPDSVIFTVDCGASSGGCAGHPRTFRLLLETNSPDGGGGPALFYYTDRTRDLDNQYQYVRLP